MSHVTIVTGGSRGIGAATSKLLASEGHAVCVNYVSDADAANAVVAEIEAAGGRAIAIKPILPTKPLWCVCSKR